MKSMMVVAAGLSCVLLNTTGLAREGDPYENETPTERDARMTWWREAKFGMFIHWGVYSVPCSTKEPRFIKHMGEWVMKNAKVPVKEYRSFAKEFTAEDYDPRSWVKLAKNAGMRYMVITSKHHDGFALYPSAVTDWDVADATPIKKDLLAPLAKAARAEGLKFGLYYSQDQDWVHPGGSKHKMGDGDGWDEAQKGSFDDYIDRVAVPQTREILTRYQPDVLWWDTPILMKEHNAKKLAKLLAIKPGIITNNRLGGGYDGDTETPEQYVPPAGFPGRDWETCMTTNDNWGYCKYDDLWMSLNDTIANLVDIVSKGGNYLLNVGPDPKGNIPQEAVTLLRGVGQWMDGNGESIYGTTASPFKQRLSWGRSTMKADGADSILYAHVLNWPVDGKLTLPGLRNEIISANMLVGDEELEVEKNALGPVLRLPTTHPDSPCTVVKVKVKGAVEVESLPVFEDPDGVIRLTVIDVDLHGDVRAAQRRKIDQIAGWDDPEDFLSWEVMGLKDGTYRVEFVVSAPKAGVSVEFHGPEVFTCKVPMSPNVVDFGTIDVGSVQLREGEKSTIRVKAVKDGWAPVRLQMLKLVPVS